MNRSLQSWTVGLAWLLLFVSCGPDDHGRDALDLQDARDAREVASEVLDVPRDVPVAEASTPEPELAEETVDSTTEEPCERRCRDRECGPDGCGGTCGTCAADETCEAGACGRLCDADAACGDNEACAVWDGHALGRCVDACVTACPKGLGLQVHDGCHCRVEPIVSATTPPNPCEDPAIGFDGYLRFFDQGNGTLLDLRSGLIWTTEPVGYGWPITDAPAVCAEYGPGSVSWRLPTIDEVVGARSRRGIHLSYVGGSQVIATMTPGDETVQFVDFETWPDMRVADFNDSGPTVAFCVVDDADSPPAPPVATRFLPLHDGSLADRITGLAWATLFGTSSTVGPRDAAVACETAGSGWRAPTFKELATLGHSVPPEEDCPYALSLLGLGCPYTNFPAGDLDSPYLQDGCQAMQVVVRLSSTGSYWLQVMQTSADIVATILCVRPLADGDGVPSVTDNCPGIPNPGQEDPNANGLGEACDPSEVASAEPDDPCASVACGVADFGAGVGWSCGACPEGLVCDAGECINVTCASDADCQADADALPGGTVRRCNPDTHACELGFDDHAEVLDLMQRIYRGAAVYYSRNDRLTVNADPVPCQFPANQGITPIEGTCCATQGGPDADGDDLCDADPTCWNDTNGVWAGLGLHMLDARAFVYSFSSEGTLGNARFTASAYSDQDCDTIQSTFQAMGFLPGGAEPCRLDLPPLVTARFEVQNASAQPIALTPAQQAAFLPPADLASSHPWYDEVHENLAAILDGAVAFYESGPDGACAFPPSTLPTPFKGTCCWSQGGDDEDADNLCDTDPAEWQSPEWLALGFSIATEHAFVYRAWWDPTAALYRANAYSDLDCDTIQSTFVRFVRPVAGSDGCDAEVVPGMYIYNETE